jgi:hypothetical protein
MHSPPGRLLEEIRYILRTRQGQLVQRTTATSIRVLYTTLLYEESGALPSWQVGRCWNIFIGN